MTGEPISIGRIPQDFKPTDDSFASSARRDQILSKLSKLGISVTVTCSPIKQTALALILDADGTIYDTEDGLYANAFACYARVIREALRSVRHPYLEEITKIDDPDSDRKWVEFWETFRSVDGRGFKDCLKRGLDGDIAELTQLIERAIGGTRYNYTYGDTKSPYYEHRLVNGFRHDVVEASEDSLSDVYIAGARQEYPFSIVPAVFKELVERIQRDPHKFNEMLHACRPVEGSAALILRAKSSGMYVGVCSAAPHNNTVRALKFFSAKQPDVPADLLSGYQTNIDQAVETSDHNPAPDYPPSLYDLCDVVRGDAPKVRKENGSDKWLIDGVRTVAKSIKDIAFQEKYSAIPESEKPRYMLQNGEQSKKYFFQRSSMVMVGDTMSDAGAALVNGLGTVYIIIPNDENFDDNLHSLLTKLEQLATNQVHELEKLRNGKGVATDVVIVHSWNQIEFEDISGSTRFDRRSSKHIVNAS